jgi:hypothetical protein
VGAQSLAVARGSSAAARTQPAGTFGL